MDNLLISNDNENTHPGEFFACAPSSDSGKKGKCCQRGSSVGADVTEANLERTTAPSSVMDHVESKVERNSMGADLKRHA